MARTIDVDDVMTAPEGTTRAGDEFHKESNWVACPACGVDCRVNMAECWRCEAEVDA